MTTRVPMPTHCINAECGRKLRHPAKKATGDGSVPYAGKGICTTCNSRARRARLAQTAAETVEISPEQHAWNVWIYKLILADRHARNIPSDGLRLAA